MRAGAHSDLRQKNFKLPLETILKLVDYCHWERKHEQDVVNLAIIAYVHKGEEANGEFYQHSPDRDSTRKKLEKS